MRFADISGGILGMATGFNPMQPGMGISGEKDTNGESPFGFMGSNPFGAVGAVTGANDSKSMIGGVLGNMF